jgi:NAD(P)-dependent dehydrogenase (short-subunit alcohol dehydrogenase family)
MKNNLFDLTNKTALITGAGGLLGPKHAEALIEHGANVIITDWHEDRAIKRANELNEKYDKKCAYPIHMNVTNKQSIDEAICMIYNPFEMGGMGMKIDILINNAAKDPKVKKGEGNLKPDSRFEGMTMDYWNEGIDAALNGTFLVTQAVTNKMLENKTKGVVLNISSDLGVIAPDQRLYLKEGVPEDQQNVKPITYSAAKWAIIGMTKYLGVYFAQKNIRVNALSPTGVYNNHPEEFVKKLSNIIPMGRMADINEYKGAIVFMCSDASSYMTGENVVIDGGKSVW